MPYTPQQERDRGCVDPEEYREIKGQFGISAEDAVLQAVNDLSIDEVIQELREREELLSPQERAQAEKDQEQVRKSLGALRDQLRELIGGGNDPEAVRSFLAGLDEDTVQRLLDDIPVEEERRQALQFALKNGDRESVHEALAELLPAALEDNDTLIRLSRTLSEDASLSNEVRNELVTELSKLSDAMVSLRKALIRAMLIEMSLSHYGEASLIEIALRQPLQDETKQFDFSETPEGREDRLYEIGDEARNEDGISNGNAIAELQAKVREIQRRQADLTGRLLVTTQQDSRQMMQKLLGFLDTSLLAIQSELDDLLSQQGRQLI